MPINLGHDDDEPNQLTPTRPRNLILDLDLARIKECSSHLLLLFTLADVRY